jgi:hypothetical protein
MSELCKTILMYLIILIGIHFIVKTINSYEFMDNINDSNVYQPIEFKEDAYKIYNVAAQGYNQTGDDWGYPKRVPIGLEPNGNLGEKVEKWLFVVKYKKKDAFKAYIKSESNGKWLSVLPNGDITMGDEEDKILWTAKLECNNNYIFMTDQGKWLSSKDLKVYISDKDDKLLLRLDAVY